MHDQILHQITNFVLEHVGWEMSPEGYLFASVTFHTGMQQGNSQSAHQFTSASRDYNTVEHFELNCEHKRQTLNTPPTP